MMEKLKDEMLRKADNGSIPCAVARKIAEEMDISYREVGAAADELGIKIRDCELGCF